LVFAHSNRIGVRVGDLAHFDKRFVPAFKNLVADLQQRWGDKAKVDVEAEIARYKLYATQLEEYVVDSVEYLMDVRINRLTPVMHDPLVNDS
jgi:adenylosuccinate synthase